AAVLIKSAGLLKEEIGAQMNEPTGNVVLSIPSSLRTLLTSRVASGYALRYPKALLKIREGMSRTVRDMVTTGEADLAVFSTQEPIISLDCQPSLSERLLAFAPAEAELPPHKPMSVKALCRSPLMLTACPNSLRQIIDRAAVAAGTTTHARIEVDSST